MKNFGPAQCRIALSLRANISENSKQNSNRVLIWGLGVIDWRKNEGRKSRDTVPLNKSKV
jgi:hypothetical protein